MGSGLRTIQSLAKSEHLWGLNGNTGFPIDSSSLLETLVLPAAPKSFDSVRYISSCLLDELNSGSKHVSVKPPQGAPFLPCLGRYSKSDKAVWPISSAV